MIDARLKVDPVLQAYVAAAETADGATDSGSVDVKEVIGVAFHVNVTEATGLTSAVMKLQESDDNSTFADCGFDDVVGETDDGSTVATITLTAVGTGALSYSGLKRYVRAVVTPTATDVDFNVISTEIPQLSKSPISIPGN